MPPYHPSHSCSKWCPLCWIDELSYQFWVWRVNRRERKRAKARAEQLQRENW